MTNLKLSRKEREYMQREALILDTARELLANDGYQSFSMDRIASEIEYSKGTIYNHFNSKEDVLSTLCCQSMEALTELFQRARDYPGDSREKISALILAYALHARLRPIDIQNMHSIKTQVMREKVSEPLQQKIQLSESAVIGLAQEIVALAIEEKNLEIDNEAIAGEMITGTWAMGYGSFLLNQTNIDFKQLGIALPAQQYLNSAQKLLDGYQWQPLSHSFNVENYYLEIGKKAFPEEMKQLGLIT